MKVNEEEIELAEELKKFADEHNLNQYEMYMLFHHFLEIEKLLNKKKLQL